MPLGPAPKDLRACATANCLRPMVARGFCNTCYQAALRSGSLPVTSRKALKVAVKIWVEPEMDALLRSQSRKSGRTVCELVRAALNASYGADLERSPV